MNTILDDDIDFAKYIAMTDHDLTVRPSSHYADAVKAFFNDPEQVKGTKTPWLKLRDKLRFRPHEVTIWSGYNGHGKSLLLGQAVLGIIAQGEKVCIASMEMTPVATLSRMARQGEGVSRPSPEFIDGLFGGNIGNCIWLYDQMGMVDPEKIAAVGAYAKEKHGCQHFVVDSLLKCGIKEDDYNGQKRFIDRLCTLARDTGIHIHLVAHARKGKDELSPPGKMDVRGAASITDQVDNVITVWRDKGKEASMEQGEKVKINEPDVLMMVSKQRHGDWEGTLGLWFDRASYQFIETRDGSPTNLLNPRAYQ
jgi:twinkle protein